MSIKATDFAFALYPVSDIDRARKFYEGALGLKPGAQMEFSPGTWWIEYDIGSTALGITNFEKPDCRKGPAVALEVTDYDAALATVKAAGLEITWGPNDFPPCRCFGIKDPDGNELYIHQRKKASA
jgi:predicted enzyme related to lactoylglutathione lyase